MGILFSSSSLTKIPPVDENWDSQRNDPGVITYTADDAGSDDIFICEGTFNPGSGQASPPSIVQLGRLEPAGG